MSNKRTRNVVRIAHLVQGAAIGIYFYSPLYGDPTYALLMQAVILPSIVLTGVFLWQQPRIMKWLNRSRAAE